MSDIEKLVVDGSPEFNKIFNFLKENLNLPEGLISLDMHLGKNEALTVTCSFYPEYVGPPIEEGKK